MEKENTMQEEWKSSWNLRRRLKYEFSLDFCKYLDLGPTFSKI